MNSFTTRIGHWFLQFGFLIVRILRHLKKFLIICGTDVDNNREKQKQEEEVVKKKYPLLRPPICCVMGQTGSGKTKLLNSMRGFDIEPSSSGPGFHPNGTTFFSVEYIQDRTKGCSHREFKYRFPGILVADIPGAESILYPDTRMQALRLCDIAVLVVDIIVGVDDEIIKLLKLLKLFEKVFIVALNKVDLLSGWQACPNTPILKTVQQQLADVQSELFSRIAQVQTQLKNQGVEALRILPTSTVSGEGVADVLFTLYKTTQTTMVPKLLSKDELPDDVVIVNSVVEDGKHVVCGFQGPTVDILQALFKPKQRRGLRLRDPSLASNCEVLARNPLIHNLVDQ